MRDMKSLPAFEAWGVAILSANGGGMSWQRGE